MSKLQGHTYLELLWDVIKNRSPRTGVRLHDLKLMAVRQRPSPKPGMWGTLPDGSPMTKDHYLDKQRRLQNNMSDFVLPACEDNFCLQKLTSGAECSFTELLADEETGLLSFPSPGHLPCPANQKAYTYIYPGKRDKAVVILPNLRADEQAFKSLARLFNLRGYTCLELVHPYHGRRWDDSLPGYVHGELVFYANLDNTVMGFYQAVRDFFTNLYWLLLQGFTSIAAVGFSLGSSILVTALPYADAFRSRLIDNSIPLANDLPPQILTAVVCNLAGGYISDFVLDPLNDEVEYVREGLVKDLHLTNKDITELWTLLDPWCRAERIEIPFLSYKAPYDTVCNSRHARVQKLNFALNRLQGKNFTEKFIPVPCGHYSTQYWLPKLFVAWENIRFIKRHV